MEWLALGMALVRMDPYEASVLLLAVLFCQCTFIWFMILGVIMIWVSTHDTL